MNLQPTERLIMGKDGNIGIKIKIKKFDVVKNTAGQKTLTTFEVPFNTNEEVERETYGLLPSPQAKYLAHEHKLVEFVQKQDVGNIWAFDKETFSGLLYDMMEDVGIMEYYYLEVEYIDWKFQEVNYKMYYYMMLCDINIANRDVTIINDLYMEYVYAEEA